MEYKKRAYAIIIKVFFALLGLFLFITGILPERVYAAAPVISGTAPTGQVGSPYSASFSVTCDGAGCTGSPVWVMSGLPPGLSWSDGTIYGTPTAAATYSVTVTVTDSVAGSSSKSFPIVISFSFTTTSIPSAAVGQNYSASIAAGGGIGTVTYALTGGTLPAGLIFNAGQISGKPARGTAGNYSFTVTASSGSATAQQTFSLYVDKGTYDVLVSISSGLTEGQTKLYVGNAIKGTLRGGESVKLTGLDPDVGVNVSVDSIVTVSDRTDIRYKAEANSATANADVTQITFNYYPEYNIQLKSDPSGITSVSGSGWYRAGIPLAVTAPDAIDKDADSQYRFAYWISPGGDKINSATLNIGITGAGTYMATYVIYYKLNIVSQYGKTEGGGWQKADSNAKWAVNPAEVAMPGVMGFFGGKYKALITSGTEIMDNAKTITLQWDTDYSTPAVTIPIALIILGGLIYGIYALAKRGGQRPPQPAAYPNYQSPPPPPYPTYMVPPPQAPQPPPYIPPPQTTVVMIGEGLKKSPATTREQLMEKFGELLQKYEDELAQGKELPSGSEMTEISPPFDKRSLPSPDSYINAETSIQPSSPLEECGFTTKKLLRSVVTQWKNTSIKPITVIPGDKKSAAMAGGRTVTWTRETYNEWELHICKLPLSHKGTHKGSTEIVYSLLNTISEDRDYGPKQPLKPPTPHYTDGMPELDISASQIVPPDQLPA